ncbi:MAG: hypothetical protein IJO25_04320, partial [Clostridia bacterium]|nr:hypothetical protein [Clostridia bacterium]
AHRRWIQNVESGITTLYVQYKKPSLECSALCFRDSYVKNRYGSFSFAKSRYGFYYDELQMKLFEAEQAETV